MGSSIGPGALLALLRDGAPQTRGQLADASGLGRAALAQRLDPLLRHDLVRAVGAASSSGGRRPGQFAFHPGGRVVLAADVGATHVRLAVADLSSSVLASDIADIDVADGPAVVLGWIAARAKALLAELGSGVAEGRFAGVGIGLPGPVEFGTGRPVNPPIMPGWHDFDVASFIIASLADAAGGHCPVVVDNDVNVMALGERQAGFRSVEHLLFVKVATGIGAGIVIDGRIRRGAQGAAGDLGHVRVPSESTARCRCGNVGCLEAVASGAAVARELTAEGIAAASSRDVADLVRHGSAPAERLVRAAGRTIGEVLASAVSLLNPEVIVVGGSLALAGEPLLAGVREVVYGRSLPLATANLRIVVAGTGEQSGVIGAATLACDHVLSPDVIDNIVA